MPENTTDLGFNMLTNHTQWTWLIIEFSYQNVNHLHNKNIEIYLFKKSLVVHKTVHEISYFDYYNRIEKLVLVIADLFFLLPHF